MSKTNYVLIHGQLVEVSDDVLMHWKYIKREKKNGRWVYYYDDSEMKRAQAEYDHVKRSVDYASAKYKDAKTERDSYFNGIAKFGKKERARGETISKNYDNARDLLKTANANYKIAEKKYNQKKVSTFAARTISKGVVKVANLFSKTFSKKKK